MRTVAFLSLALCFFSGCVFPAPHYKYSRPHIKGVLTKNSIPFEDAEVVICRTNFSAEFGCAEENTKARALTSKNGQFKLKPDRTFRWMWHPLFGMTDYFYNAYILDGDKSYLGYSYAAMGMGKTTHQLVCDISKESKVFKPSLMTSDNYSEFSICKRLCNKGEQIYCDKKSDRHWR